MIGAKKKLRAVVAEWLRASVRVAKRLRPSDKRNPAYESGYEDGWSDGYSAACKDLADQLVEDFKLAPARRKPIKQKRVKK